MEKRYNKKNVFSKRSDSLILWKDVKHFEFQDDDVIAAGWEERESHEDASFCHFIVTREVLETDEDYERRIKRSEIWNQEKKDEKYKLYLKLKSEFENLEIK